MAREVNDLRQRARAAAVTALEMMAQQHGLSVQHLGRTEDKPYTVADFEIGHVVGYLTDLRAGYILWGSKGYISTEPHCDDVHSLFYFSREFGRVIPQCNEAELRQYTKRPSFGYVRIYEDGDYHADNVAVGDTKRIAELISELEITPESCVQGRELV